MEKFYTMRKITIIILLFFFIRIRISPDFFMVKEIEFVNHKKEIVFYEKNIPIVAGTVLSGFTLAEVLVTLTVVGVVASLVIPPMVHQIEEEQCKIQFKRVYNDINQATERIMQEKGGTMNLGSSFYVGSGLYSAYKKYLNYTRDCAGSNIAGNCWHISGGSKLLNGDILGNPGPGFYIVLNNGAFVNFFTDFNSYTCSMGPLWGIKKTCAKLNVDVNGFKGPNTWGKDIYGIWVIPEGIVAFGTELYGPYFTYDTNFFCDPGQSGTTSGLGCAAKVLKGEDY